MLILYVLDLHEEVPYIGHLVRGSSLRREVTFSIDVKGGETHEMQDNELDAWRERKKE
jgi:hypothetical protein